MKKQERKGQPRGRGAQNQQRDAREQENALENWKPKTWLGKQVKEGKITSIDEIFDQGKLILEPEIVDFFFPDMSSELLLIGQSKGKFGGGQRRVFRQTQKKTKEGNKPKFATMAVVGNKAGYVGIGFGKAKETVPAREKAFRNAKLNLFKVIRGSGSWESQTAQPHSIPFTVEGKCGSVEIKLIPAPKGKGLVTEKEIAKILGFAGIKDVWSKTRGQTKNKINLIYAAEKALRALAVTKVQLRFKEQLGIGSEDLEVMLPETEKKPVEEAKETKKPAEKKEAKEKKETKSKK